MKSVDRIGIKRRRKQGKEADDPIWLRLSTDTGSTIIPIILATLFSCFFH